MTDPLHPGTSSEPVPPVEPAAPDAEPPTPDYEVVEVGQTAAAEAVARDSGTFGAQPASGGSSRARWAIALVGVALVGLVTAAIIVLAAGRPSPSIAVGYMPEGVTQYAEIRLDLPGDQRQKLAGFLQVFPGFDDQAAIDTKLDETFDRIIGAATENEQTYTADIKPWFGGQIAFGSSAVVPPADPSSFEAMGRPDVLLVASIKDRTLAAEWIEETAPGGSLSRNEYNGAILFSDASELGEPYAIAVNDEVILAGQADVVKAAVDSNGDGKLADDPEFKAAFGAVTRDYVLFSFADYEASITNYLEILGDQGAVATMPMEELLEMFPGWLGTYGRFENDAFVTEAVHPSFAIGYEATNKKSTLLGHAPPGTVVFAEAHDVGAAFSALYAKFEQVPEFRAEIGAIEQQIGIQAEEIYGWWGDAAVVVAEDSSGLLGAGVLIAPTDPAAADRLFEIIRSLLVFGGGQAGLAVRDVEHGDATITVIDFSGVDGMSADSLPDGYKAEIAYTVTDDVVVIGFGQAFVESVLDAGPGPSLADDGRVTSLVERVGDENTAFAFVDVRAVRELLEPIARADVPADAWARYETETQPFLLPFDALAWATHKDGDLDRHTSVITVTQPPDPASAGR